MLTRIITGLILAGLLAAIIVVDHLIEKTYGYPPMLFMALCVAFVFGMNREFWGCLKNLMRDLGATPFSQKLRTGVLHGTRAPLSRECVDGHKVHRPNTSAVCACGTSRRPFHGENIDKTRSCRDGIWGPLPGVDHHSHHALLRASTERKRTCQDSAHHRYRTWIRHRRLLCRQSLWEGKVVARAHAQKNQSRGLGWHRCRHLWIGIGLLALVARNWSAQLDLPRCDRRSNRNIRRPRSICVQTSHRCR